MGNGYIYIHVFLTSTLVGGEWLDSRPCRFSPGERVPNTHWIRGLVDRSERYAEMNILNEFQPLGHPLCSQLLYRLRYRG
jgi:hypothetical protein